jgi:hypothetical protein
MLSRRDLISAGIVGGLAPAAPASAAAAPVVPEEQQAPDRDGQREIARRIGEIQDVLRAEFQTSSLSHGIAAKLRGDMEQFMRANTKFPDYIEVGVGVFIEMYDWHVKNGQELAVTRLGDGRYTMRFMFTTLILRPEQDRNYVGVAYDRG